MSKIEIKNKFTGEVIHSGEYEDIRACLIGALKSGADLRWANLSWTNLAGVNLTGADLRWADLRWANISELVK